MSLPAIAAAALCVFLILLTFLAWNLKIGHDPALGTYAPPAQQIGASGKSHPGLHNLHKSSPAPALVTRSSGGG
jgi:hypothetical protein